MKKPKLNRIVEAGLIIEGNKYYNIVQATMYRVFPAIESLKKEGVKWYCFLFHGPSNGVYDGYHHHVRFELPKGRERKEFGQYFDTYPEFMENPEEIKSMKLGFATDFDPQLHWKIVGEQSEFVLNLYILMTNTIETKDYYDVYETLQQYAHYFEQMGLPAGF